MPLLLAMLSRLSCSCISWVLYIGISNLKILWSCLRIKRLIKYSSAPHLISGKDRESKISKLLILVLLTTFLKYKRWIKAKKQQELPIILHLKLYFKELSHRRQMFSQLDLSFTFCNSISYSDFEGVYLSPL